MTHEEAIARAQSHEWVVSVPMPVSLQLGEDGSVSAVVPAGLPALDQVSPPTCRRCGATTIDLSCEEVDPTIRPHAFLIDYDGRCVVCSQSEDHPAHERVS